MSNILYFPMKKRKQNVILEKINKFLKKYQEYKEKTYKIKIEVLFDETYKFYLKKVLKRETLDLPDFFYFKNLAVHNEAKLLAERAILNAELLGEKHINKCYQKLINKKLNHLDHKSKLIIKRLYI